MHASQHELMKLFPPVARLTRNAFTHSGTAEKACWQWAPRHMTDLVKVLLQHGFCSR